MLRYVASSHLAAVCCCMMLHLTWQPPMLPYITGSPVAAVCCRIRLFGCQLCIAIHVQVSVVHPSKYTQTSDQPMLARLSALEQGRREDALRAEQAALRAELDRQAERNKEQETARKIERLELEHARVGLRHAVI